MDEHIHRRDGYSFHLVNIDCLRTSTRFNVIMDLENSIRDLLPYMAACLPGCSYVHGSGVINLMDRGHIVGVYPLRITITDVEGLEEADRLCKEYFDKIREVRARKGTIAPVYERRPSLTVIDILRALPRTNCKACNAPTCMAFAAKVFRREAWITECPAFMDRGPDAGLLKRLESEGYMVAPRALVRP